MCSWCILSVLAVLVLARGSAGESCSLGSSNLNDGQCLVLEDDHVDLSPLAG